MSFSSLFSEIQNSKVFDRTLKTKTIGTHSVHVGSLSKVSQDPCTSVYKHCNYVKLNPRDRNFAGYA